MKRAKRVFHPLAFCTTHGVFPATAIALGAGSQATFSNCAQNCPICNAQSEIISGTYKAGIDRVNLLLDPRISQEALRALAAIASAAKDKSITAEEAKRAAEKIHPSAGKLFDVSNWSDQAKATLYAAIIGAAAILAAARITSSTTPSIVVQPTIERVVPTAKMYLRGSSVLSSSRRVPLPKAKPLKRR